MKIKDALISLGLTKNEVAVYTTLLELGITQAGPLVKKTKLHRMLVYNALESLTDRGLVSVARKKNIKLFQPGDPDMLRQHTHRLQHIADAVVPELRLLQEKKQDIVNVKTLIGAEGLATAITAVIESAARQKKKEIYIMGGGTPEGFYTTVGDWYYTYRDLLDEHKVKKILLADVSTIKGFKTFIEEDNTEMRILDHGLSSPTFTRITKEMVSIEMHKPQPVAILIQNPTIASAYLDSFNLLWKTGKPVPRNKK